MHESLLIEEDLVFAVLKDTWSCILKSLRYMAPLLCFDVECMSSLVNIIIYKKVNKLYSIKNLIGSILCTTPACLITFYQSTIVPTLVYINFTG